MKFFSLLENLTGATIIDCIIDEKENVITIAVKKGEVGRVIGRGGEKINRLRRMTNKQIDIFEYIDDSEMFIRNALKPAKVKMIRLLDRVNGSRVAVVEVDARDKRFAIGRNGQNIKKIRFLAKRYFNLDTIVIK